MAAMAGIALPGDGQTALPPQPVPAAGAAATVAGMELPSQGPGGEAPERYALVLCDVQNDILNALSEEARTKMLAALHDLLEGARRANWHIVFTGLRFPPGYEGVPTRHRLFGGLRRLNAKQGDERVHWLMEGYAGSEIHGDLAPRAGESVLWRQQMRPSNELSELLRSKGITKVALGGLKAAQGVLATCQALADDAMLIYVVRECVEDDNAERRDATLDLVLPQYADVFTVEAFREQIQQEIMMDMYIAFKTVKPAG
mmetsp:Transcript_50293/g.132970  ORF Transcript_50293/g.132970 Transcript_50293/m.132970 type:complete len:258 (-) Transcript_50293:36-809(-)